MPGCSANRAGWLPSDRILRMNELLQSLSEFIPIVTVYALPVLFAIAFHEAAHAYAAKRFGDTTAFALGRMSLNPAKHIDPFGTIVMPLISYISMGFPFGYAKPVPVDSGQLRKPKQHAVWVALAGPAANFLMALLWLIFSRLLEASSIQEKFFVEMASAGVLVNQVFFALNLFPLPPLDGGRILISVLPNKYSYHFSQIEPYGFFIVMMLIFSGAIGWWMSPIISVTGRVLLFVVSPLKFLFY